jgi:hypothetical protein
MSKEKAGNVHTTGVGANFAVGDPKHDMYVSVQKYIDDVSRVGKKARDFVDRSKKPWENNIFGDLKEISKVQDSWEAPDERYGTQGRGKKNFNRMEYDIEMPRIDIEHDAKVELDYADSKKEYSTKDFIETLRKTGITHDDTTFKMSDTPIKK